MSFMVLALVVGMALPAVSQEKMNISFGGSSPGGMMYYLVGAAGNIITRDLPAYNITQVTTGGSTENAKRLLKGELDMGIVYGPHVYMSLHNQGPFKDFPKGTMLAGRCQSVRRCLILCNTARFGNQDDGRPGRKDCRTRSSGIWNCFQQLQCDARPWVA